MDTHSTHIARAAKRRAHKPLNLQDVLKILTSAIREAERLLYEADDPDFTLRCIHALSQACGQYSKLMAEGELEARLSVVEGALKGQAA
jgi:hypothetical protein